MTVYLKMVYTLHTLNFLHGHAEGFESLNRFAIFMRKCERALLKGEFGPLWSQKLKVAFHQFHQIGLLENSGIYFTFTVAMLTKKADKIGLKLRNCHFIRLFQTDF